MSCDKFNQQNLPCSCTYSTAAPNPDATVVLTKIGDDFPFRGIDGINGIIVSQTADTIIIDGGGGAGVSLQSAYNGGNTIVEGGGLPVDITASGQPTFIVRDLGNTEIFNITNTVQGDALIRLSNNSGLIFNNPITNSLPTINDPFTNLRAFYPPSAINNTSTITSVTNVGAAVLTNLYASFIPQVLNTVNDLEYNIVGYIPATNQSFSITYKIKYSPTLPTQAIEISKSIAADPGITQIDVGYIITGVILNIVFIYPGAPLTARVQYFLRATILGL